MPESDQQQIQRWKQKYYDSLGELETKEKQWQQIEHLLRQAVSRLTLAADPAYPTLVGKLDDLRKAIRDGHKSLQLQAQLDSIGTDISRLDERRQQQAKQLSPAEVLGQLVDELKTPRNANRQVRLTRQKLFDAKASDAPDTIVADVAALINALLQAVQSTGKERADTESGEDKQGLLKRFWNRDTSQPAKAEQLSPETEFTGVQPPTRSRVEAQESAPATEDFTVAAEVLTQLIERLDLPEDLQNDAENIKQTLQHEPEWYVLSTAVTATAELVAVMRGRLEADKMELEAFLKQLTLRLREIDDGLQGSAQLHKESQQDGVQLNDAVASEMNSIEGALAETHDVGEIKSAVQQRLENMRTHMTAFRATLDKRAESAEQQIIELQQRLNDVEQEGERLRSQLEAAHNKAIRDPLTGAPNRLAYEERINNELNRYERYATPVSLMVWDVDHFKKVNDTYGHQAGDKVLKVITDFMSERIRSVDFIARYGGEEFVVVLPETRDNDAATIAEELRKGIAELNFHYHGSRVEITASCGFTECRTGDTPASIFERADKALYQAKQQGRNRCIAAHA